MDRATVRAHFEEWLAGIAEDIDNERGARLRELLDRAPFTQRKLADAVGVDTRTVQRWLTGKGIRPDHREPLANALGSSVAYVMHGEIEGPDPHDILGRLDAIQRQLGELTGPEGPTTYADLAQLAQRQQELAATVREMSAALAELLHRSTSPGEGSGGEGPEFPEGLPEPPEATGGSPGQDEREEGTD